MSNQLALLNGANVPAAFHSLMQNMQSSELSQNVGANFAVVSIKGKVFRIKHGGTEYPLTIQYQGREYAAPYMDVIIPQANAQLSKTYYVSGYTEGSDESPTCWSEDGRNPLAPLDQRPKDAYGRPATDCQLCPMNAFGSKINEATGAKGKACADTRKLAIIPIREDGTADFENAKFNGPMLLRVPAASLAPFAEYDRRLQSMGVPYFAVVTRLEFDTTVAYPKFKLTPVRLVNEQEAQQILALRDNPQITSVLGADHHAASALAAPEAQQMANVAAPVTQAVAEATQSVPNLSGAPAAPMPMAPPPAMPTATPVPAPAPATAAPVQAAPTAPPVPAPVAPAPTIPAAPPAPVQAAPAPVAPAPAPAFAPPAAPAPMPAAAAPAQLPPAAPQGQVFQPAPAGAPAAPATPTVDPSMLSRIDQLLQT